MRQAFIIALFVSVSLIPAFAFAQSGLVACRGLDCGTCEFVSTVDRVISFLIALASIIATIVLVYVGLRLTTSAGNSEVESEARRMLWNIVLGLFFVIAAYAIINVIMLALLPQNSPLLPWTQVECIYAITPNADNVVTNPGTATSSSPYLAGDCTPANFEAAGVPASAAPTFSCLSRVESGCNLNADNPNSSARGVLQVLRGYNNDCHNLNNSSCTSAAQAAGYSYSGNLDCSRAFRGGDRRPEPQWQNLADACDAAASNFECNAQAALCLYNDARSRGGTGYEPWTGGASHTRQRSCVSG